MASTFYMLMEETEYEVMVPANQAQMINEKRKFLPGNLFVRPDERNYYITSIDHTDEITIISSCDYTKLPELTSLQLRLLLAVPSKADRYELVSNNSLWEAICDIQVKQEVTVVVTKNGRCIQGVVRFIDEKRKSPAEGNDNSSVLCHRGLPVRSAIYLGLELMEDIDGGSNGHFEGQQYFHSHPNRGVLVHAGKIKSVSSAVQEVPDRTPPERLDIGDRVILFYDEGEQRGEVRYIGLFLDNGKDDWYAGVCFDEVMPDGGTGKLNGKTYFKCEPGRGKYVPLISLMRDYAPVAADDAPPSCTFDSGLVSYLSDDVIGAVGGHMGGSTPSLQSPDWLGDEVGKFTETPLPLQDPEYPTSRFASHPLPATQQNVHGLDKDSMCTIQLGGNERYGLLRYMGRLPNTLDGQIYAGLEMEAAIPGEVMGDGTYAGRQYFSCRADRGIFVPMRLIYPDPRFRC